MGASRGRITHAVEVVRLRGEVEARNGRIESALKELEDSRACVTEKTRDEARLREDGAALRARIEELEGATGGGRTDVLNNKTFGVRYRFEPI